MSKINQEIRFQYIKEMNETNERRNRNKKGGFFWWKGEYEI